MMNFKFDLCDSENPNEYIAKLDLNVSECDYRKLAQKINSYVDNYAPEVKKESWFGKASWAISKFASEKSVALLCRFIQGKGKKEKVISFANRQLEKRHLFFRLKDFIVTHI